MAILDRFKASQVLLAIYERERQAIVSQNYDLMAALVDKKLRAMRALSGQTLSESDLAQLQSAAERNQVLLAASAKGINAVRDRLKALNQSAARDFKTYGPAGAQGALGRKSLTIK